MPGVVFIVTIPTENEEQGIVSQEQPSKFGHSSKSDAGQKYESGAFKVVCFVLYLWKFCSKMREFKFIVMKIMKEKE